MAKFKVGDKVKCIQSQDGYHGAGWIPERIFIVADIDEGSNPIYWSESGNHTIGGVYEKALELVNKQSIMKKLGTFFKKLTDEKTQKLAKAGFINGDLEPTEAGIDALNEVLWFEKLDLLVAKAEEVIKEEEEESKK